VIQLKHLDENKSTLERIGLEETYKDILGLKIPHSIIPVALGRTVADIIEIAVKNFLLKKNGIDSGKMFSERVDSLIKKKGSRK
ncbi:MAG: HPr kinase/phosphorylase, partial [Bacillales bacterium]|nr:HPr kinase/phosphorylase [Bacillales bacterium]